MRDNTQIARSNVPIYQEMNLEQGEYERITNANWSRKRPTAKDKGKWRGPFRLLRLCMLAVVLPGLLVAVPLYLKYRVLTQHLVPLSMSDMRLMDSKISTTWCQRQLVTSNATFNAYLIDAAPKVQKSNAFVNMVREVQLEDDMMEYWGFYLIKGSTVSVSSCARRPGASLIVIRGHHHLRQCAYIGDDSSEEQEELDQLAKELNKTTAPVVSNTEKKLSNKRLLHRVRPEVQFTGKKNSTQPFSGHSIITKNLDLAEENQDDFTLPEHRTRTRVPTGTKQVSREVFKNIIQKLKTYQKEGKDVMSEAIKHVGKEDAELLKPFLDRLKESEQTGALDDGGEERETHGVDDVSENPKERHRRHIRIVHNMRKDLNSHDEIADHAEEQGVEHEEVRGKIDGRTPNDTSNSEFWSSFSSSEERLLECEGLIISQPLNPSALCSLEASAGQLHEAADEHRISYTVPANGYYFFVFSSENEIESNFIHAEFTLEKMLYDVSNAVSVCMNATSECALPLRFFSDERLVLELPVNDSLWNDEFIIVSTCEPRTALYIVCVVAVPILILIFAF